MIFLNRRRTPLTKEIVKDPSKYWYVEKYVYGGLKETVEVALGEGITFTEVDSGYADDLFNGWNGTGTATSSTFNTTTTYKNTTTSIKNKLDSENTLKIYAVYKYATKTATSYNGTMSSSDGSSKSETRIYKSTSEGTITFSGGIVNNKESSFYAMRLYINDKKINSDDDNSAVVVDIKTGDKISFTMTCTGTTVTSSAKLSSTVPLYDFNSSTKLRVASHT